MPVSLPASGCSLELARRKPALDLTVAHPAAVTTTRQPARSGTLVTVDRKRDQAPSWRNRRLSRRAAIGGGAAFVAGLGALAVHRSWPSQSDEAPGHLAPAPEATVGADTEAVAGSTPAPAGDEPRGFARLTSGGRLHFDTLDAVRTGEPSLVEVLGRTHSRLVSWAEPAAATLEGDLAESWERPDDRTWIFHLNPGANWHARPGLDGRAVESGDVQLHLQRVTEMAAAGQLQQAQRPWDYAPIESIESAGGHAIAITTSRPYPHLLAVLAGQFAFVQRPEAIPLLEQDGNTIVADHVSGSGPFRFDGKSSDGSLKFGIAGRTHHRPRLAEMAVAPAARDPDSFLARRTDEFIAFDRRDAAAVRATSNGHLAEELSVFDASSVVSPMHVGSPPWNDDNLRIAFSAALNRHELARRLFAGRAHPAGHVHPSVPAFALPEGELNSLPGYLPSFDDDAREARARWEAAAGAGLGPLTIDFPAIFDPLYSASSVVPGMLREVLGLDVIPRVESYPNIASRTGEGRYGNGDFATWFGWALAQPFPDPSLALIETFASASASAIEAGFASPDADRLTAALDETLPDDERVSLVRELDVALVSTAGGGVIPWLLQRHNVFRWPYLSRPAPSPFGIQHLDHRAAVDTGHGRYPPERVR